MISRLGISPFKSNTADRPAFFSKVLFIINPVSGTRRKREKLKSILKHLHRTTDYLDVSYTTSALDATRLVRNKKGEEWTLLLCAGGDGTVNEVVNGLLAESDGPSPDPLPPLGILPTGTGNGLAREIGVPLDPTAAYQAILRGTPRPIFPGIVNRRYFILLAGSGFDAFVADRVEHRKRFLKKIPKLWTYFLLGFTSLFSYPYPTLRFNIDGASYTGSTGVVTRARLVIGPFVFAAKADLGSPFLTLCLFRAKGILGYLWISVRFLLSGKPGKGVQYIEGKEISATGCNALIQADGEQIGTMPARFTVSERPIALIYPNEQC